GGGDDDAPWRRGGSICHGSCTMRPTRGRLATLMERGPSMEWLSDPQSWIAFLTLAALEIVLGIDNIVFISILVGKLPAERQGGAYRVGLALATGVRVLLLLGLSLI